MDFFLFVCLLLTIFLPRSVFDLDVQVLVFFYFLKTIVSVHYWVNLVSNTQGYR